MFSTSLCLVLAVVGAAAEPVSKSPPCVGEVCLNPDDPVSLLQRGLGVKQRSVDELAADGLKKLNAEKDLAKKDKILQRQQKHEERERRRLERQARQKHTSGTESSHGSSTGSAPVSACYGRVGFDIGYGSCTTYAPGQSNHYYCSMDGAIPHCSECGGCGGSPDHTTGSWGSQSATTGSWGSPYTAAGSWGSYGATTSTTTTTGSWGSPYASAGSWGSYGATMGSWGSPYTSTGSWGSPYHTPSSPPFAWGPQGQDECPPGYTEITDDATCEMGAAALCQGGQCEFWPWAESGAHGAVHTGNAPSVCNWCTGCSDGTPVFVDRAHGGIAYWLCQKEEPFEAQGSWGSPMSSWSSKVPTMGSWSSKEPMMGSWSSKEPTMGSWSSKEPTMGSWSSKEPTIEVTPTAPPSSCSVPNAVLCGGHRAACCEECPLAPSGHNHGLSWCNGECSWNGAGCVDPSAITPAPTQGSTMGSWSSKEPTMGSWTSKEPTMGSWSSKEPMMGSWSSKEPTMGSWSSKEPKMGSWSSKEPTMGSWSSKEPTMGSWSSKEPAMGSWSSKEPTMGSWSSKEPTMGSWSSKEPTMGSWSSKDNSHTHFMVVDGCTSEGDWGTAINHGQVCKAGGAGATATAAVRCCSHSGNTCYSRHQGNCFGRGRTYQQAVSTCAANGMRLCTMAEVATQMCCTTGCNYDSEQVWTSDSCSTQVTGS